MIDNESGGAPELTRRVLNAEMSNLVSPESQIFDVGEKIMKSENLWWEEDLYESVMFRGNYPYAS